MHKQTKDRYRVPGVYSNNARKIYKAVNAFHFLLIKILRIPMVWYSDINIFYRGVIRRCIGEIYGYLKDNFLYLN